MYGKVAIAAAGLLAAANARPAVSAPPASVSASFSASFPVGTGIHGTGVSSSSGPMSTGGSGGNSKGGVFSFPLSNGFPNINVPSSQLTTIELQAHGTLSNGAPPTGLQDDTLNSLAFIAFNELFEVAFFTELVQNVTRGGHGFMDGDLLGQDRATVLANLKVILAQEELHVLNAEGALKANSRAPIAPCTYKFPVTTFEEAIGLASTFTDVVLGTLPDIQTVAATVGDIGLVRAVGSVIGQEGEQNGFYRSILGKAPSALPFLTGSARNFAFNAILQSFVVECPADTLGALEQPAGGIPLNQTGILNVLSTDLGLEDTVAQFSVQTVVASNTHTYYANNKSVMNFITYVNQQNVPLSVPITDIAFNNNEITFKASFPGKTAFLNGLTIAAVTETNVFTDVDSVATAATFGPGLIEVN